MLFSSIWGGALGRKAPFDVHSLELKDRNHGGGARAPSFTRLQQFQCLINKIYSSWLVPDLLKPIEEKYFSSGSMICVDNKLHLQSFGAKKWISSEFKGKKLQPFSTHRWEGLGSTHSSKVTFVQFSSYTYTIVWRVPNDDRRQTPTWKSKMVRIMLEFNMEGVSWWQTNARWWDECKGNARIWQECVIP